MILIRPVIALGLRSPAPKNQGLSNNIAPVYRSARVFLEIFSCLQIVAEVPMIRACNNCLIAGSNVTEQAQGSAFVAVGSITNEEIASAHPCSFFTR